MLNVVIDFDGVLHNYQKWDGIDVINDGPIKKCLDAATDYLDTKLTVNIFSSRSREPEGIAAIKKALIDWGYERLAREALFPDHKVPAMVYIDDRGLTCNGSLPDAELVKTFVPWNKWHTLNKNRLTKQYALRMADLERQRAELTALYERILLDE